MPEDETDTGSFVEETTQQKEEPAVETDINKHTAPGKQKGIPDQTQKKRTKYSDWQ